MRRSIDSFAEYERQLIAARTKAALKAKRARGERVSRFPPFGWSFTPTGRLTRVEDEQSALATILTWRAEGLSMPAIARRLNQLGLRTRAGSPWRFKYVRNLLSAPVVDTPSSA